MSEEDALYAFQHECGNVETFKELWDTLETKYMAKDASSKKFLVSNFTNYKMTDLRPVLEQYNKLLGILGRFTQHKINMNGSIQVSCIIDKNPPSWKDFKHTLKHLKEKLTLIELGSHLRIEESLRVQDSDKPKGNNIAGPLVVNMMEHNNSSRATVHVCKDRCWFKTYELLNDGSILHIGNESTALVHGRGCVDLRFSSGKVVSLLNVLYVPNNRKNLVSSSVLNNCGYKQSLRLRAAVRLPDPKLKTLDERGIECIFVGYAKHFKAFRFYVIEPNDLVSINYIIESREAIFDEHMFSSVPRPSQRSMVKGTEDSGGTRDEASDQHSYCFNVEDDLKTFNEAMKSQNVAFWKEAITDEMDSIMGNNTWVLTDLPPGCRPLGYKWIFKRKLKVDGTIEKFKARLGIQGFKQKSGIDYFDTYAPVARISTIRLLIAMASIHNLIIHQMDVKTTFLNEELKEEVYMNQPLGFIMPDNENKVDLTKEFLSLRFSMKDIGEADVILGIRIKHESNGIAISRSHYIEKDLKKFNYSDCTPVSTPLDTCEKLIPKRGLAVSQLEYFGLIGCLMYAMTYTRPDIAFAVGKLSRLVFSGYPSVLEGYIDASWISNTKDNSSTSGWVFLLGGGAIYWAFKKQTCITGSIIESEFVALAADGKEAE
nr:hypothetical protein [Tanacetum cinerariifolium]